MLKVMLKYFKNWKNLNRHKTAFSSLWLMISNRYIYNTNIQCSNKSIVVSVEWYWYSYSIFIFISIYPNSVHIITHNNCTVLVFIWSVSPQIKCPGHPFSSKMMMSLKRLKSFLLSEEVLDYLRKMEGTIIDHLITEKVVYDESVIIRFTWLTEYLFLNFLMKIFQRSRELL